MKDPIVEEVDRIKEQLAAKFNFDIHAMAEDMQRRQWESGHPVMRREGDRWVEVPPPPDVQRARERAREESQSARVAEEPPPASKE
jgi:hypothetical protein